jgi:hypothetical protein
MQGARNRAGCTGVDEHKIIALITVGMKRMGSFERQDSSVTHRSESVLRAPYMYCMKSSTGITLHEVLQINAQR